jgi:hypothetical protein
MQPALRICATSGLLRRSKRTLMDHRVTERADRHRRHIDAGPPGGATSDVGRSASRQPGRMPDVSIGPR